MVNSFQRLGDKIMNKDQEERLKKILNLADKLHWAFAPSKGQPYPIMLLSEVEKCMIAMVDDFELKRMESWVNESKVT